MLIDTWSLLSPDDFHYTDVHRAMLKADRELFDGFYRSIIDVNFNWRDIGSAIVGPQLPKDKEDEPGYRGHKDKKHKLSGLNENLAESEGMAKRGDEPDQGERLRKSYAERYREARIGE